MFLPLAMAVLSGSMPMIEYPYVGIMPHFRCVGTYTSLFALKAVKSCCALATTPGPTGTRLQTVLASRTSMSALLPSVLKRLTLLSSNSVSDEFHI
jgi:hypothetical protein